VRIALLFLTAIHLVTARQLDAQCTRPDSSRAVRVGWIGSAADDSARASALIGCGPASLIRSEIETGGRGDRGLVVRALAPRAAVIHNSDIPVSMNDGALWAGRGVSTATWIGGSVRFRNATLVLYPQVLTSENLPFPIYPSGHRERSAFASPWYSLGLSADMPMRFGDARIVRIDPGETTFEVRVPHVTAGLSSAEEWWGPGIRNALLLSNNAGGIPRAYIKPSEPIRTRLGTVDGRYLLGMLQESPFFDHDTRNDLRFLSAGIVTLRTAVDSGLTIGIARSVYGNARGLSGLATHTFDVLTDWHRVSAGGVETRHSDQLFSLMAQWFVGGGLEVHGELAKLQMPTSLRQVIVDPHRNQGYTVGLSHTAALAAKTRSLVVAEVTTLEQTPVNAGVRIPQFYASNSVIQGYTSRGQVIGAGIGPGSSSQYLGALVMYGPVHLGAAVGRIRWQEDIYYSGFSPSGGFTYMSHDVSLFTELTARYSSPLGTIGAVLARTHRYNYLSQTADAFVFGDQFDRHYSTLSLRFEPRWPGH
jgi:hypothetical protein